MFQQLPTTGNKTNRFIRPVNDGDAIKGIFQGTPFIYQQHWTQTPFGRRSAVCTGTGCQYCAQGDRAKFRFRCNFLVVENGMWTAKIYEGGKSVYEALAEQGTDYDLSKTLLKISRKGSGMDTTYSVVIAPPNAQPTAETLKQVQAVTLLELDPTKEDTADASTDFAPADTGF